ncbi:MAG: hypothetical protein AAFV59_04100 [Pseudomonadota bacterium]
MRVLTSTALAIFALPSAFAIAQETTNPPPAFVGEWSCVYTSAYDPDKYAPRAKSWTIMSDGNAIATGRYTADHSTGIQGKYRSNQVLSFQDGSFTQELLDYKLVDPVRNGEPMTDLEISNFERQVMSGEPVSATYEWLTDSSFRTLSQYTDTLCERAKEVSS